MELVTTFIVIVLVLAFVAVYYYNKLVGLRVRVDEGWSDITVQLKRRHDLIGNLVETVKGYATHEKETLGQVIAARNAAKQAEGAGDPARVAASEMQLTAALQGLNINALAEAYPDLKANTNFQGLQTELSDTENKIAASRRFYNSTVRSLNTAVEQFPGNMFASLAKAARRDFFELEAEEEAKVKEAPKVSFSK
ncbi:LemA family protein [Candidatus Uhrbacteria bacterium]|nr:LemA family protein [Candidatus Uhrbacteria bacterium]